MSKATVKARPYETIAKLLRLDAQDLERDSLRLYLRHQLRRLEANIFTISRRYGVQTVEDMEQLYEERKLSEKDSWEDFFELDHLEAEREAVRKALEAL